MAQHAVSLEELLSRSDVDATGRSGSCGLRAHLDSRQRKDGERYAYRIQAESLHGLKTSYSSR